MIKPRIQEYFQMIIHEFVAWFFYIVSIKFLFE